MTNSKKKLWLILISFFLIYIVWGSTYLANAWAVEEVPPFMFAGTRFLLAGVFLMIIARFFGPVQFSWTYLFNTAKAGFLLFAVGNGLLVWALQFIDSGLSALIVAFEPLLVVLLIWYMKNKRPDSHAWIGIVLGMVGMTMLVGQPEFTNSWVWIKGAIGILVAISAWAYISIWIPEADLPPSIFQSASMQMFFGGFFLAVISFFFGEFAGFSISEVSSRSWWALWYLLFFGSMLAFSAFNYLLKEVGPVEVSTCTFVNPVVAVLLGFWLNKESFSGQSIFAAALMLTGVVFINGHARIIWAFLKGLQRNKKML